ncbi:uncharacterized protein LOC116202841 isoform X1 [Punica granatum]|uniref:Uncharacterized protein LOC116202841 isoform X1 n=1 Tax=Punica granatum TaxID=22663 RepID=A0A6P8DG45_PUNGR|nr:uncharacterized protein LOC116202841 isoform X1 [Punica granatum]
MATVETTAMTTVAIATAVHSVSLPSLCSSLCRDLRSFRDHQHNGLRWEVVREFQREKQGSRLLLLCLLVYNSIGSMFIVSPMRSEDIFLGCCLPEECGFQRVPSLAGCLGEENGETDFFSPRKHNAGEWKFVSGYPLHFL